MRELIVWGGLTMIDCEQVRTIVATRTKKRAVELLNITMYDFNGWWCRTGNEIELKTALGTPETVFISTDSHEKKFKTLKDKKS